MSIEINNIKNNLSTSTNGQRTCVAFKTNPIPQDKVEISSKKKGLSDGAKIGIGIGIAGAVGLGIYKRKSLKNIWEKIFGKGNKKPPKEPNEAGSKPEEVNGSSATENIKKYLDRIDDIKENFSKIFGRDFTKDEANEMALKYKEIFEIENDGDFANKIFSQLKNDYKLPDGIPMSCPRFENGYYACFSIRDGLKVNLDRLESASREDFTSYIAHELKHAKQDEICCRVDLQKYIEACVKDNQKSNLPYWQRCLRECGNNVEAAKRKNMQTIYDQMLPSYKNLEKITQDSPLYQKGLDYIENFSDYKMPTEDGYWEQLVEREACDAGTRIRNIYKWIMNK